MIDFNHLKSSNQWNIPPYLLNFHLIIQSRHEGGLCRRCFHKFKSLTRCLLWRVNHGTNVDLPIPFAFVSSIPWRYFLSYLRFAHLNNFTMHWGQDAAHFISKDIQQKYITVIYYNGKEGSLSRPPFSEA